MAVARREKASDAKYKVALGGKEDLTNREADIRDVVEDLRDDVNNVSDLANILDGYTFAFTAATSRVAAKLTITHTSSSKTFIIDASN